MCQWLNSIGVTGVLLKYRVPKRAGDDKHLLPLADAQRALRLVRFHATQWRIAPKRIGVLGFSAGGHLAVNLSNNYDERAYEPVDEADQVSARPDFALAIYPAYLAIKEQGDKLAPELKVTANTPPTFLVQTEDDGVRAENSVMYYLALKHAKVPVEMHLYAAGGHGYGLRPTDQTVTTWPQRAAEWLRGLDAGVRPMDEAPGDSSRQARESSVTRRERGQVHVFGRRFLRQKRFPAEKWTSPHPG